VEVPLHTFVTSVQDGGEVSGELHAPPALHR